MAVIPKLKEGQYSHKKRVPMKAKMLERQLILKLVQGFILLERTRHVVSPKQAPQVWITELPPASIIPIFKYTKCSLRVYPIIWIVPINKISLGPTLPISPPKEIRTEPTEYEHLIRKTMSMLIRNSEKPWPKTFSQKGLKSMQNCETKALIRKVQARALQAQLRMKVIRKPKPINIITLTSWKAGYLWLSRFVSDARLTLTKIQMRIIVMIQTMIIAMPKVWREFSSSSLSSPIELSESFWTIESNFWSDID